MKITQSISCPLCKGNDFVAKYEASYVYTYKLDALNTTHMNDESQNLPFLFDKRDKSSSKQYIECTECGAKYPCSFRLDDNKIDFTILRKAIRADHATKPEFFG